MAVNTYDYFSRFLLSKNINICLVWFDLVSLFNGISTLSRLFNAKAILLEEQEWYYLTHSWEDKGVHTFPKGICPKVNIIARLAYELAYYDSAVQLVNHYTTRRNPHPPTHLNICFLLSVSYSNIQRFQLALLKKNKIK